MTRKSKRELERKLEGLSPEEGPRLVFDDRTDETTPVDPAPDDLVIVIPKEASEY